MGNQNTPLALMGILMLSIGKLSSGMTSYFLNQPALDDYYLNSVPDLSWLPTHGASLLGLSGKAEPEVLRAYLQGTSPITGEPLVANAGHPKRVLAYDCCFSPPKEFSILWSLLPPEERVKMQQVCQAAVIKAIQYLEDTACVARRGHGGCRHQRASFLAVACVHFSNRSGTVQYHVHCLLPNLALADGKVTAIHAKLIYRHQIHAGVLFQKELARGLEQEMGIKTVFQGRHCTIPGLPKELCDRQSPRREEILQDMARKGDFSPAAAQKSCLDTRRPKKDIPPEKDLFRDSITIASQYGFSREQALSLLHRVGPTARTSHDLDRKSPVPTANPSLAEDIAADSHPTTTGLAADKSKDITRNGIPNHPANRPRPANVLPSERSASPSPEPYRRSVNMDAFRLDARLTRQIQELLSDPSQPRVSPALNTLIRHYLEADSRLRRSTERQVQSLLSARRRAVRPGRLEAVLSRYSHERHPLVEAFRFHCTQLWRAAMNQPTRPIDREQIQRDAQIKLNQAHAEAVRSLVRDRSRLSVLRHKPGYNSDWVIRVAREAWQRAGYQVLGTSLTRQRAHEMLTQLGIESMTLRTLHLRMKPTLPFRLKHATRQLIRAAQKKRTYTIDPLRITKKTILVVDAAASLNMSQMAFLIEKVKRQGGKLVLVEGASPAPLPNTAFDLIAKQVERTKEPPDKPRPEKSRPRPVNDTPEQRPNPFSMEI